MGSRAFKKRTAFEKKKGITIEKVLNFKGRALLLLYTGGAVPTPCFSAARGTAAWGIEVTLILPNHTKGTSLW